LPQYSFGIFASTFTEKSLYEYDLIVPELIIFKKFFLSDTCQLTLIVLFDALLTFVQRIILLDVGSPLATP